MIDYLAVFVYTNLLAFPDTLTVNASGPSATDGTEVVKAFGDDIWGARQAVMDFAGLVPDGVTEAPGTSQFLEALLLMGPGPGIGIEWLLNDDPAVTGHRVLLRNGQGVLIANYPLLDAAVYVGDANNAAVGAAGGAHYRASDAAGTTPNIAGPYLILGETRGYSPRGLDLAASVDPDGASRYLGDPQVDAMQGHWHSTRDIDTGFTNVKSTTATLVPGPTPIYSNSGATGNGMQASGAVTDGVNGVPRIDVETRGSNFSTIFGIGF